MQQFFESTESHDVFENEVYFEGAMPTQIDERKEALLLAAAIFTFSIFLTVSSPLGYSLVTDRTFLMIQLTGRFSLLFVASCL